jgi:two-component system sensor histidine kinase ChvG
MSAETDIEKLAGHGSRAEPRPARHDAAPEARASTEAKPRARRAWRARGIRSPLTRRILALNVLVLVIPVLGLLHLDQYRQTLIESEIDSMHVQARTFALTLGSTAVVGTPLGEERLMAEMARSLMRVLLSDTGVRARIFDRAGELVADSFVLVGPGGHVQVMELPSPDDGGIIDTLERWYKNAIDWLPSNDELPLYQESGRQLAFDYSEVQRALFGEAVGMARADRQGRLVLSVAVPVQRYRQVLGALMLSKDGAVVDAAVRDRRLDILLVFAVALGVTVLLSLYLAGTIARPIHRLALAAEQVRHGKGRTFEIPDFSRRHDEIGDLSVALREMTEALWTRLDAIEGFAADVAHEIKNPLTSLRSAVETVVRVEDPEQQKRLMSIILDDVQRLDRLISDISGASRLDAELSRTESEPVDIGSLLRNLVEAQNATAPDDSPRLRLQIANHSDLIVSGMEDRLGQVMRNLVNNAITFSPPGGEIVLGARAEGPWVVMTVSDEGPGIPDSKLSAIFDRFYTERPSSEKFGTHSGLGLSISKQIVEAHGGSIFAENRVDGHGKACGARFTVRLPKG